MHLPLERFNATDADTLQGVWIETYRHCSIGMDEVHWVGTFGPSVKLTRLVLKF
jgi:hypothetical protein